MKAWLAGGTFVLLLIGAVAAWWFWPRESAQVAKIKALQDEMFAKGENLDPKQGREMFEKMGKEMETLSEDDRQKVMSHGMDQFQQRMAQQFDRYFNAPAEDRTRVLDEDIDRMNRFMAGMFAGGPPRNGSRPPGGPPPGGGERPPGGGPPWGRGGTPEERNRFRTRMLDGTTPVFRAQAAEYFSQLMERRRQRGMPEFPMPGRR